MNLHWKVLIGVIGLVMSEEFARKHKFRRIELERPVYVRNVDRMFNYTGPIVDTVEVEILSQIRYSLVVILELNSVSEV